GGVGHRHGVPDEGSTGEVAAGDAHAVVRQAEATGVRGQTDVVEVARLLVDRHGRVAGPTGDRALLERNAAVGPGRATVGGPTVSMEVQRSQIEPLAVVPGAQAVLPEERRALLGL